MVAILGDAGKSIADLYDVDGSIVSIRELHTGELPIVHEMGATVFSERCSAFIRRLTTGAILQSVTFDLTITDLPSGVWRVLGVSVFGNVASRLQFCQVSLRDPLAGREVPFFVWDTANDAESNLRITDGGAPANQIALIPGFTQLPTLGVGSGQPQRVQDLAFRGQTTAFGAGTLTLVLMVHVAFSQVGGLSSRGLPIPSW